MRISGALTGVDHHQFYLDANVDDFFPEYPMGQDACGLVAAVPSGGAICVTTGIATGTVALTIDLLDAPPAQIDASEPWEVIGQSSFRATAETASIFLLMDWPPKPFDALELPAGAGWYAVRAHAIGRALDYDLVVPDPFDPNPGDPRERHLLQVWPTPAPSEDAVLLRDEPWARQGTG
ncbi:hypothetical protein PZ938_00645 [Luteipulveratus sp. YIM 133132]|uniref:Uncharacterized protein n=1 Tax=Luteipulveratus flavus TaxID=3031728 RepID=A0ABT6C600_9MICO|nr:MULTISPECIES: hypothetical protein [unclassified Luteipulveratus]MDE9364102.1 hypothetical protein [Luteipulveratus sp. YIM 133132]MDF8264320.1 hypothetical protein [Luteipulveratus sp. YIM 133296]